MLDLKRETGRDVLYDLVEAADVVVENFRPGTAEGLQIEYGTFREYNEKLVYCSISAFGETGPWTDRPGYDTLVQGMSVSMNVTGYEDHPPVKVGLPETDLITAMWSAFGIVNALYNRERTGEGERVELGMLDAALPWLTKQAGKVFVGELPRRMGTRDPVIAPYQTLSTADGYLNVACGNQQLWQQLCDALNRQDLAEDERFASNPARVEHMDELASELEAELAERTTDEWFDLLADEHGLPMGSVFDVNQALDNEQVKKREIVGSVDHPAAGEIPVIEHPLNQENVETGFEEAPPLLDEDTEAILKSLRYEDARIEELRNCGAIPGSKY